MKTRVITLKKNKRNTTEYLEQTKGISVSYETVRINMTNVKRVTGDLCITN
jgi:hypothetical protein